MIDNLAARWSKEETELLAKHLHNQDYEELLGLFPGRTKAGIKAKQKRLLKENPIPRKEATHMFRYYLDGEAEGQILQRLLKAGITYTLKDITLAIKNIRKEIEDLYVTEHSKKPTLDQLKEFVNGKKMDN